MKPPKRTHRAIERGRADVPDPRVEAGLYMPPELVWAGLGLIALLGAGLLAFAVVLFQWGEVIFGLVVLVGAAAFFGTFVRVVLLRRRILRDDAHVDRARETFR